MDKIWLENGLDLRMSPYTVQPTSDQVGLIQIVTNADTTEHIQNKYGSEGFLGALGINMRAFNEKTIVKYLRFYNSTQHMPIAIDNFRKSCAGYCVATFVLGIGDRHSGNIMVKKSGHMFHIDFGHFLGNFKSKYGIKRERTAFVFTKDMAEVIKNETG